MGTLVQRPIFECESGHGHCREHAGDRARIVLDIDAATEGSGRIGDALARDDCSTNVDGVAASTGEVEGSPGNDDPFEVDPTIEVDVAIDNQDSIAQRPVSR